jgi:hypothetical protein
MEMQMTAQTVPSRMANTRGVAARITSGILGVLLAATLAPIVPILFSADPEAVPHHTHEAMFLVFGLGLFIAGLVAVAIRPETAPAALRMMIVASSVNAAVSLATTGFDPFVIILFAVPTLIAEIGGFRLWRGRWVVPGRLAVLPTVMLVALVPYAWRQIELQLTGSPSDPHVEFGHYAGMATVALSIALAGLVVSAPIRGRYFAGTVTGVAAATMGMLSMVTGQVSSFGLLGEVALIVGGLAFAAQVQVERLDNPTI